MKFCANVSLLFAEVEFVERFGRAAEAGFAAVEFWWPSGEELGRVEKAIKEAGLEVALFNFDAGDMSSGDRGFLSDPERHQQFRDNVPTALEPREASAALDLMRLWDTTLTASTLPSSSSWLGPTSLGPPTRPPRTASKS